MTQQEIFLKTVFCCMACDGDIAPEEVDFIRNNCTSNQLFRNLDVENLLTNWLNKINNDGRKFLYNYLKELEAFSMTKDNLLLLLELAMQTIEADNIIEYSEVAFFKQIRKRISLSDEDIIEKHPIWEEFLLSDINTSDEIMWDTNTHFSKNVFDNLKTTLHFKEGL